MPSQIYNIFMLMLLRYGHKQTKSAVR
jgi:hypothetical protein